MDNVQMYPQHTL